MVINHDLYICLWSEDDTGLPGSSAAKNPPAMLYTVGFLGLKDPWRRDMPPSPVFVGFLMAQMDHWVGMILEEWLQQHTLVFLPENLL